MRNGETREHVNPAHSLFELRRGEAGGKRNWQGIGRVVPAQVKPEENTIPNTALGSESLKGGGEGGERVKTGRKVW